MTSATAIPAESVAGLIVLARGQKVLLDADLAVLYGVPTKQLNKAVKRNSARFPDDFMFQLTDEEVARLRFQFGTSSPDAQERAVNPHGGRRYRPYAFTEQGVAMLSSVLHSERAIVVNIAIMRAFVRLRHLLAAHADLAQRLDAIEREFAQHRTETSDHLARIMEAIQALMSDESAPAEPIGFQTS